MSKNGVPTAPIYSDSNRPQHLLRSLSEIQLLAHENTPKLNYQGQLDADG
jgi:hypothetical protein